MLLQKNINSSLKLILQKAVKNKVNTSELNNNNANHIPGLFLIVTYRIDMFTQNCNYGINSS